MQPAPLVTGKMDPIGFALENFDAIGVWRTQEGGFDADATGELPGDRRFSGPAELKALLLTASSP